MTKTQKRSRKTTITTDWLIWRLSIGFVAFALGGMVLAFLGASMVAKVLVALAIVCLLGAVLLTLAPARLLKAIGIRPGRH